MRKRESIPFVRNQPIARVIDDTSCEIYIMKSNFDKYSLSSVDPITSASITPIWYVRVDMPIDYRPNEPFDDTLYVVGTHKARFILISKKFRVIYTMTAADMADIIMHHIIDDNGVIKGTWKFVKHGHWGIMLVNK